MKPRRTKFRSEPWLACVAFFAGTSVPDASVPLASDSGDLFEPTAATADPESCPYRQTPVSAARVDYEICPETAFPRPDGLI